MTRDYLESITPDSFSGILFALEGIRRSLVLLNGPTGCKFYHSSTSDSQMIRQPEFDPLKFPAIWYFGQPRVPCTYLDTNDYVYGSGDKLEQALDFLSTSVSFELLCIVNSPGAALIGDDLRGIADKAAGDKPCIVVETPGFSDNVCMGYETGVVELLRQLHIGRAASVKAKTVNILGLSLFHRNFDGDARELRRLFELCGITVNCVLCAGCGLDEIRALPEASLNVVLCPEYGAGTARYLEEVCGTPYYICDGLPIGFAATERIFGDICGLVGADATELVFESERARAKCYAHISRVNSLTGLPKGVTFAVEGTYSELYSYVRFLGKYFGMIADCVVPLNTQTDIYKAKLERLLAEMNLSETLHRDIGDTAAEMVFGSGNTIARLKQRGHIFCGVEIALPSLGYVDVLPKTNLGLTGAQHLTEQVLNALLF